MIYLTDRFILEHSFSNNFFGNIMVAESIKSSSAEQSDKADDIALSWQELRSPSVVEKAEKEGLEIISKVEQAMGSIWQRAEGVPALELAGAEDGGSDMSQESQDSLQRYDAAKLPEYSGSGEKHSIPETPPPLLGVVHETQAAGGNEQTKQSAFDRLMHNLRESKFIPSTARAAAGAAIERTARTPEQTGQTMLAAEQTGTQTEQLGKRELLRIAKDILIDGVRLKDIYDAKRLDEAGLRAVVECYLRGGDVKQQLARELLSKESSYERDPNLRHTLQDASQSPAANQVSDGVKAVGRKAVEGPAEMLGAALLAGANPNRDDRQQASPVSKNMSTRTRIISDNMVTRGIQTLRHDLIENANIADWLSVTAVVLLYSIILILLVR
jgi:hypothetical protein